ncbi:alpha/beta fold hydrolase [Leptolyngbya sp. PCC 6406]|uniref:alpha/beta fold hydrolase n=1 Tax=Leptolyngbya sp. PCC 6406 TaxID=1173264 RepID=UPI0002ACCB49|nr:alpha/beta hydrolase [Leptolyngbya sp. PCC 6406]
MYIAPGFEMRSQVTALGTIAYGAPQPELWPLREGEATTLVFLHGFGAGSSAYEWSLVYPAFAADYRVIAPDLPGWGQSDHPVRDYQAADYEDAIAEFLEKVCPEPALVVASSLTAALMVRVAIAHPELVRGLVLVTPSGLADFGEVLGPTWLAPILRLPLVDRLLYWSAIATREGVAQFLQARQFANPQRLTPEMVSAYLASAQQPNAEYAALSFVRGDLSFDLAEILPQLTVPTAVLWGEAAQFTPVALGERLMALNTTAIKRFQILPGVGLTPQLEQPETTIAQIRLSLQALALTPV